jgi:uncharacterized membrane protein YkvA (DUF1232 family)
MSEALTLGEIKLALELTKDIHKEVRGRVHGGMEDALDLAVGGPAVRPIEDSALPRVSGIFAVGGRVLMVQIKSPLLRYDDRWMSGYLKWSKKIVRHKATPVLATSVADVRLAKALEGWSSKDGCEPIAWFDLCGNTNLPRGERFTSVEGFELVHSSDIDFQSSRHLEDTPFIFRPRQVLLIQQLLRTSQPVSKAELAKALGVGRNTVGVQVEQLEALGLLKSDVRFPEIEDEKWATSVIEHIRGVVDEMRSSGHALPGAVIGSATGALLTKPNTDAPGAEHYSEDGFNAKLDNWAVSAGKEVVFNAVKLYFAAIDPKTEPWAKAMIFVSLGYFIFPLDAIPDLTPIVGYTDDAAMLTATVGAVGSQVTSAHIAAAKKKIRKWFS